MTELRLQRSPRDRDHEGCQDAAVGGGRLRVPPLHDWRGRRVAVGRKEEQQRQR